MASCAGLPICLSGIQIFPQNQHRLSRRVRSHTESGPSAICTRACFLPEESAEPDYGSTSLATTPIVGIACDHGDSHDERALEMFANRSAWPRLVLAQQMADLDLRREAVKRRSSYNRNYLMDYRISPRQNEMMVACLKNQEMSTEGSLHAPTSICAKAA